MRRSKAPPLYSGTNVSNRRTPTPSTNTGSSCSDASRYAYKPVDQRQYRGVLAHVGGGCKLGINTRVDLFSLIVFPPIVVVM